MYTVINTIKAHKSSVSHIYMYKFNNLDKSFDYIISNNDPRVAYKQIWQIVEAETHKVIYEITTYCK